MKYYSLHGKSPKTSFKTAVIEGLAKDKGVYFPEKIKPLSKDFISKIGSYSNNEIAFEAIKQFIGDDIPPKKLKEIISKTLSFDFPIVNIEENIASLELFHGPTKAFKDVGAKFMAKCLEYFNKDQSNQITVLVATSGDTGGAVARGFLDVKGVNVIILYPSGKVSKIQEKQLTTLGKNITALEINGDFDDCQNIVKTAFLDNDIKRKLTSANSINIARWLPQMFYFFFAYKALYKKNKDIVFSVPSGNFGNICAGIVAQKLGLPIKHFVASTNSNDTVPNYLIHGIYKSKPSKATISNAMDVGNPSNFIRIRELFGNDLTLLKKSFSSFSFSDNETRVAMRHIYKTSQYISDPHGAIGYLGLKKYGLTKNEFGVFLETAHPIKFLDIVEETLNIKLNLPQDIKELLDRKKVATLATSYDNIKEILNN